MRSSELDRWGSLQIQRDSSVQPEFATRYPVNPVQVSGLGGGWWSLPERVTPNDLKNLKFCFGFNPILRQVMLRSRKGLAWCLAIASIGACSELPCRAVFRAWHLVGTLMRTWIYLDRVTFPSSLQSLSLTFGENFNHSLVQVTLPSGLQSLSFGWGFDQRLDEVMLPSLQSLTIGGRFTQSLEHVTLPSGLAELSVKTVKVSCVSCKNSDTVCDTLEHLATSIIPIAFCCNLKTRVPDCKIYKYPIRY